MSEPQIDTNKAPLWKQCIGALAGAMVAFVVYQGYAFTSSHLEGALVGERHPRPSGTLESPDVAGQEQRVIGAASSSSNALVRMWSPSLHRMVWVTPSSSSSSAMSASSVWAPAQITSSSAQSSSPTIDTSLFGRIDAAQAETMENPYADAPTTAVPAEVPSDPAPVEEALVEPSVHVTSSKLPQTGFGLDLIAFAALGAVVGSRRMQRTQ